MKTGDWVRFYIPILGQAISKSAGVPAWEHGLLIEYQPWEKIARILHEGKVISIPGSRVQLAERAEEEI